MAVYPYLKRYQLRISQKIELRIKPDLKSQMRFKYGLAAMPQLKTLKQISRVYGVWLLFFLNIFFNFDKPKIAIPGENREILYFLLVSCEILIKICI